MAEEALVSPKGSVKTVDHWLRSALLIFLAIVALQLFKGNLEINEPGKLALAYQQVDPTWQPIDWYLNDPQPYQWLFQQLAGRAVQSFGFPLGSLIVRSLGYAFWSIALARVALQIKLKPVLAALAVVLFMLDQSVIAGEWMLGSAEPKTFAYAAALMAYASWQERKTGWAGFFSGLACSFHLLVGLYSFIALAVVALWRSRWDWKPFALVRWSFAAFLAGLPIVVALFSQLWFRNPEIVLAEERIDTPSANWIYVFLRNPHHLVPQYWTSSQWLNALAMLMLFAGAAVLCLWAARHRDHFPLEASQDLAIWALAGSLIPALGLLISLVDGEGGLLKLYLFRFGDTVIPLVAWLLLLCWVPVANRNLWPLLLLVLIVIKRGSAEFLDFSDRFQKGFIDSSDKAQLYDWLDRFKEEKFVVMTPPGGFEDLQVRADVPGFVQFKLIPNRSTAIKVWYVRLTALAGGDRRVWEGNSGFSAASRISSAYRRLGSEPLADLARRYGIGIVVTDSGHPGPSGWKEEFRNDHWSAWLPAAAQARRLDPES